MLGVRSTSSVPENQDFVAGGDTGGEPVGTLLNDVDVVLYEPFFDLDAVLKRV